MVEPGDFAVRAGLAEKDPDTPHLLVCVGEAFVAQAVVNEIKRLYAHLYINPHWKQLTGDDIEAMRASPPRRGYFYPSGLDGEAPGFRFLEIHERLAPPAPDDENR